MSGVPLISREIANCVCNCTNPRGANHMCRQDRCTWLSTEEQTAAEESLNVYCKPIELYNIIQCRAVKNPPFLQRCLRYKIQAKQKKRIEMTVSLLSNFNDESRIRSYFPLCIMLARPVYNPAVVENSTIYHFNRACILTKCTGFERTSHDRANFVLPEINKMSTKIKSGSLSILLVSCANLFKEHVGASFSANVGGNCFMGKIPLELLHLSWENSPNLGNGDREEMLLTVDLQSYYLKTCFFGGDKCLSFQNSDDGVTAVPLQVSIVAEEIGAKERSPYDSFSYSGIPSSILPQIIRLRTGNVVFNYRYYDNKLQKTEVTEDFTCPFCLVKCASFKGLRCHLPSSHDLLNFEFWVTEDFQAVNVSVKSGIWRFEAVGAHVKRQEKIFMFCNSNIRKRTLEKNNSQLSRHVHPILVESAEPGSANQIQEKIDGENGAEDTSHPRISSVDTECVQSVIPIRSVPPRAALKSVGRSGPRNSTLLRRRQFFHSRTAQPMSLEEVLSDYDSEGEVDDDVADLEDKRMLDEFVDVTKDEKQMMHLWNCFVRRQRVKADGHVPWACEAFTNLHGPDLVKNPGVLWCWRLHLIKMWNHGLIDAVKMNECNIIIEKLQNQDHP